MDFFLSSRRAIGFAPGIRRGSVWIRRVGSILLAMLCAVSPAVGCLADAAPSARGPAQTAPLLVCLKGNEVSVSSDHGRTCVPTPLPAECGKVYLAPGGGSAWILVTMANGTSLHRFSWDGSRWVDSGPVLESTREVNGLYPGGNRTALLGIDRNGAYQGWASNDDGRTWTAIKPDNLGRMPDFDGADLLRSSAVKTAAAMRGSENVNDADVWADPSDRLASIAYAFTNSGPAIPSGTRARLLATNDGGKTWMLIEGPPKGEVRVLALGGGGDKAIGVLFTWDSSKTWVSFDLGRTWSERERPDVAGIYGVTAWLSSISMRRP